MILADFIAEGFVIVFIDDILVMSLDAESHLIHVERLVARLREKGFKVKLSKCDIMRRRVQFLGNVVGRGLISPDPSKISALYEYERPTVLRSLQAFLGLVNHYRRYIPKFAEIAKPLYELMSGFGVVSKRKNGRLQLSEWTEAQKLAFDELRRVITSDSVLMLPNFERDFIVTTDACDYAVGGVLSQMVVNEADQANEERPVAYFSRIMKPAETRYSTTEKELLAIVLSIENWHYFLYGRLFQVRTDHQPLSWLLKMANPSARLCRWLIRLENYDFEIVYKPGKENGAADGLSRMPESELKAIEDDSEDVFDDLVICSVSFAAGSQRGARTDSTSVNVDESELVSNCDSDTDDNEIHNQTTTSISLEFDEENFDRHQLVGECESEKEMRG